MYDLGRELFRTVVTFDKIPRIMYHSFPTINGNMLTKGGNSKTRISDHFNQHLAHDFGSARDI